MDHTGTALPCTDTDCTAADGKQGLPLSADGWDMLQLMLCGPSTCISCCSRYHSIPNTGITAVLPAGRFMHSAWP